MTKAQTLAALGNQLDSFYSLEQVIKIVESIEEVKVQTAPKLTSDQVRELTQIIVNAIEEEAQRDNIVCMDDVEFELGYDRRIEVSDVPINFDAIRDCVESELTEYFEEEEVAEDDLVELERED